MANHKVETGLSVEDAKRTIDAAFKNYSSKYPDYKIRFKWLDANRGAFAVEAKGHKVEGMVALANKFLEIQIGKLPFLLSMLEGSFVEPIRKEILMWAAACRAGRI